MSVNLVIIVAVYVNMFALVLFALFFFWEKSTVDGWFLTIANYVIVEFEMAIAVLAMLKIADFLIDWLIDWMASGLKKSRSDNYPNLSFWSACHTIE